MLRLKLYWNEKCAYQGPNFLQDEIIDCERHRILNDFVLVSKAIGQTRKYKTEWNSPRDALDVLKGGQTASHWTAHTTGCENSGITAHTITLTLNKKRKSFCHF